jgi:hypothetical protein
MFLWSALRTAPRPPTAVLGVHVSVPLSLMQAVCVSTPVAVLRVNVEIAAATPSAASASLVT